MPPPLNKYRPLVKHRKLFLDNLTPHNRDCSLIVFCNVATLSLSAFTVLISRLILDISSYPFSLRPTRSPAKFLYLEDDFSSDAFVEVISSKGALRPFTSDDLPTTVENFSNFVSSCRLLSLSTSEIVSELYNLLQSHIPFQAPIRSDVSLNSLTVPRTPLESSRVAFEETRLYRSQSVSSDSLDLSRLFDPPSLPTPVPSPSIMDAAAAANQADPAFHPVPQSPAEIRYVPFPLANAFPKYSDGPGERLSDFLNAFENALRQNNIADDARVFYLLASLDGAPKRTAQRRYQSTLPGTYDQVVESLIQMYAAMRDAKTAIFEIAAAKRGPLESYAAYCERLMTIANNCDPRIPESVVVRQVLRDLPPTSRDVIKQARPETIPELMVQIHTFGPQLLYEQRATLTSSDPTDGLIRAAPVPHPPTPPKQVTFSPEKALLSARIDKLAAVVEALTTHLYSSQQHSAFTQAVAAIEAPPSPAGASPAPARADDPATMDSLAKSLARLELCFLNGPAPDGASRRPSRSTNRSPPPERNSRNSSRRRQSRSRPRDSSPRDDRRGYGNYNNRGRAFYNSNYRRFDDRPRRRFPDDSPRRQYNDAYRRDYRGRDYSRDRRDDRPPRSPDGYRRAESPYGRRQESYPRGRSPHLDAHRPWENDDNYHSARRPGRDDPSWQQRTMAGPAQPKNAIQAPSDFLQ